MQMIGSYTFEEYLKIIESFHGAAAPGLILGGFMVDRALSRMPKGILLDAICETPACLPDAIQLLTPCTIGNGWMKIINLGRFALTLYEKYSGEGVRVFVDPGKLEDRPEIRNWLFKLKPKKEQDSVRLIEEMRDAGADVCGIEAVRVQPRFLGKKSRGGIGKCVACGEPYPLKDGPICRGCAGEAPYVVSPAASSECLEGPKLKAVPVEDAVGKTALHDMTRIVPGSFKGPLIEHGGRISPGDVCRLHLMGRENIYVREENSPAEEWVHEDVAAIAFAAAMAGEGVTYETPPREGKINLTADRDGLLWVDVERLERFNMIPGVMCASRRGSHVVPRGRPIAATRAIPLFLRRDSFDQAMAELASGSLFRVLPLRKAGVGVLVTGNEVFQGLIEDKFIPIITAKVEQYGCGIVQTAIVPDDRDAIAKAVGAMLEAGADLVVTTAGLSVDPDDVTRQGLIQAGASDMLYGAPVIPGAMLLLARIGSARVIGVPACALFFKTTALDLVLPRVLAGEEITRKDLARMGHGSFCLGCKACTFPKCPFGG